MKVTATRDKKTRTLEEGKDYTVDYSYSSTVPLKGKFKVKFIGNYKGRAPIVCAMVLQPAPFTAAKVSAVASDLIYTEAGDYNAVVYTSYNGALLEPKDYTVRYLVGDVDITDNKKFTTSIISMQEQPLFSSRPLSPAAKQLTAPPEPLRLCEERRK